MATSGCALPFGEVPDPLPTLLNETTPDMEAGPPCELLPPPLDPAALELDATAMPADEFWGYIDLLGGTTDEAGMEALTSALAERDLDTIVAFDERLLLSLYSLDFVCRYDWYIANDPLDIGYLGDDGFLYARADTVAAGRENFEAALAEGTIDWGTVDPTTGYGEILLYVAWDAATRIGLEEEYWSASGSTPISFETGSNPAGGW